MKIRLVTAVAALFLLGELARAQEEIASPSAVEPLPALTMAQEPWLADRGEGIHTSQFGTHVRERELLVYLFYEYTINRDNEYKPEELGFVGSQDFTAKRVEQETLLYAAYGLTRDLMVEFESALWARATQWKSSQDTSAMPQRLSEYGVGDTEGQVRYRWLHETEDLPEAIAYFEAVLPLQRRKVVIGTQDWEFALGLNVTKGFSWGTLMAKVSMIYERGENKFGFGEYGIEYLKRLSDQWSLVLSVEGTDDEVEGIVEFQWRPWPNVTVKLNNGFGITSKAPEWAPEIGIVISF